MLKLGDSSQYTFKLSKNGEIIDADRGFVEKMGYDLDSILSATIYDLTEDSGIKERLESGGEVEVVGVDGESYHLHLYSDGEYVYAYDVSKFCEVLRSIYAGVWDFYYGLLFVDEQKRILAANNTFYSFTGLERVEGKKLHDVFPELSQSVDEILKRGEGEVSVKINNRLFHVRVKVREVSVLGKRVYEVLARTLTEEKVRNLRSIFDDFRYPVVALFADEIVYHNKAAENLLSEVDLKSVKGKNLGSVRVGDKEYLFFKIAKDGVYLFVEDLDRVLRGLEEELVQYKLSFENSVDAIIIVDREGTIIHTNPAVKLHGYTPEELIGRNVFEFIHPSHLEEVNKAVEEGRGGKFRRMELRIRDKSGSLRWVEVVGVPIRTSDGEVTGGILVLRDVTTRKELQQKLVESEELYRTLTENSHSGIYVIQDGELVYMNKATQDYTGYTLDELRKEWKKVFDRRIWDEVERAVNDALSGKVIQTFSKYYTKSGEGRYASFVLSPITFRGKPAVLGNFIDVTSQVLAEKKLRESEELYRTLAEHSHTGIFIIQNDKVVYGNEKLREILGYTIEEVNSLEHPYKVLHPDFYDKVVERYRARERGEEVPNSYEVKVLTKDGKEKWLKVLASRISYRGKPAVMANIADITDLKEREEMLKRLNLLLRVTSVCSREISQEKTEFKILSTVRKHLERAGLEVAVYLYEDGLILAGISRGLDEEKCEKMAMEHIDSDEIKVEKVDGKEVLILPISNGRISGVIMVFSEKGFSEEEISVLEAIGKDVKFAFKSLKIEREKEAALKVIMENLSQFEHLADRLRNPLAIIKGYLEIRENFSFDEFAKRVEEQVCRIENILDELRAREIVTYEIKKLLEG
ncbi:PAS domain S-box protein [Archaeoglobus fulgidus]|uniref:histidine kinase n=1 Tax=Archaeoglobus fulgidus (strain ATCC 49558 / DSM 4304 / JCM 9628 / NBRC 100126 / VC-16) TaxID=224325 RepID=O29837_ARCFU|nr:PAS domain S-box protein [Archaeoglobus fulgidus]AAB90824.1 signal-transducing histidine kinase, putative [Archaeoglobus fulgidus DSM 4304]